MPNWKKVITSGSDASLTSVIATAGFTGSLLGTASYATQALSASYAPAFPFTGSAQIIGSLGVTGSLSVSGSFNQAYTSILPTLGLFAYAQGIDAYATGDYSHAEGNNTSAIGNYSHAEGYFSTAGGSGSHAEGSSTANGDYSHAEGFSSIAIGPGSHAEGYYTTAFGTGSHAEGYNTTASGDYSHAEGFNTVTSGAYQHVQGQYNQLSSAQSAFIVGNGTSNGSRSNLIFASGSQVQVTGSVIATAGFTGSLQGTAVTASYALTAQTIIVEPSSSAAIKDATGLSKFFPLFGSVKNGGSTVDAYYVNSGSFQYIMGTNTLTVTSSYANQALSSSFAVSSSFTPNAIVTASVSSNTITFTKGNGTTFPITVNTGSGGAAFPFTGSAQITGSLGITGSLVVNQNATTGSLNTSNRTLQDTRNKTTVDWDNWALYDSQPTSIISVEWYNRTLYSSTGYNSILWDNRILQDSTGIDSSNWDNRTLNDDHGAVALSWDAYDKGFTIASNYYYRSEIGLTEQQAFVDTPEATTSEPNYAGEVITGTIDDTVTGYDLVYLNTNGVWYPVTQATDQCTKLLGISLDPLADPPIIGNRTGAILLEGTITVLSTGATYADSPIINGLDHGLPIYIENSYGNIMTTTAPTNSGTYVRVLGHAYQQSATYPDYWIMKFRPSNDWITI